MQLPSSAACQSLTYTWGTQAKEQTIAADQQQIPKAPRNARIEALRLVAIVAIAVFHTFQPWFAQATGTGEMNLVFEPAVPTLAALGFINLLGAFGNNVFFMISGYFLVPGAAACSGEPGYWGTQTRRIVRRAASILVTVALYAALALVFSRFVIPIDGVSPSETYWLLEGLEFIWVYLAVIVLVPAIGWVWAHLPHRETVVWALTAAVFALNAYVAFVSPGSSERGLLEWRKLLSAATYLVAFLIGGVLAQRREFFRKPTSGAAITCAIALFAEILLAASGRTEQLAASSYKSTSLLSFAMAVAAVAFCASRSKADKPSRAGSTVTRLAASILGFYVLQSMFYSLWEPAFESACAAALAGGGEAALLGAGIALSFGLVAVAIVIDQLVRVPLLRALKLQR